LRLNVSQLLAKAFLDRKGIEATEDRIVELADLLDQMRDEGSRIKWRADAAKMDPEAT
jgi:hypothetical protein